MHVHLLILAAEPVAAPLRRLAEGAGARVEVVETTARFLERLRASTPAAVALHVASCEDELTSLAGAAEAAGAERVLVLDRAPEAADYEQALDLGALGALHHASTGDEVAALLERLRSRVEACARVRGEVERWQVQSEELRRRCKLQAENFQETQETFYLDLSRMMTIITNIMDGIVFVDRAGDVTLMNPVAEDLLGVKSFVAIGKSVADLRGQPELLEALVADHERVEAADRKERTQTVEVHHGEQDLLYIKCMTSSVLDYRGQPAGVLTVLRDVTAEFKTDQLKNQYLSIVAHELRTPLTGIKTFASMMAKGALGDLNDNQERACESIKEQSLRLEHQIDKLINLGNLESEDYGQDRDVVALQDFFAGMLSPFEQPARDRGIDLQLRCEVDDEALFADRSDLRRACQALIENAVKFARDGGRVEVAVLPEDEGLCFHVRDDGIGVDPRYHRRIFEKFFQVEDPLTRHHGGAGLGLFVSQGIVEAHGSRIEVSSQLGRGADFSFMLPLYRPEHVGVGAGDVDRLSEDS